MAQIIRLIKPYSLHSKGTVLTLDHGVASELIRSGRAEAVEEEPIISMRHISFGETVGEPTDYLRETQLPDAGERRTMPIKKYWKADTLPAKKRKNANRPKK